MAFITNLGMQTFRFRIWMDAQTPMSKHSHAGIRFALEQTEQRRHIARGPQIPSTLELYGHGLGLRRNRDRRIGFRLWMFWGNDIGVRTGARFRIWLRHRPGTQRCQS
jgi:hypothetical protein